MFDLDFLFIYLFRNIYLAMNLSLVLYFFIAGLGMYILSFILTNSKKAAFVSALFYMFNGFVQSFVMHGHINILEGYALTPFIFLFVYKAVKSRDWAFYSILAGIFFAMQIFAGSMILFFYTALIVLIYLVINSVSKNFRSILIKSFFVGMILAVVCLSLASVKLLPVLDFTKLSSRSDKVSYSEYIGEPINLKDFSGIFIGDFGYAGMSGAVGFAGLILLCFGLSNYKKRITIFSVLLVAFSILFASATFVADFMYKVPGFDKLRHVERAMLLFVFAASVLSAYGFAYLSEKSGRLKFYLKYENFVFAGMIIVILTEILLVQSVPQSARVIQPKGIMLLDYISKDNSTFRTINLAQQDIIGAAGYNYYAQEGISEAKGGGGIWINDYVEFVGIAQQYLNSKMLGILNVKYAVAEKKIETNNFTFVERFEPCKDCAVWNAFGPYLYKNENFAPRYYVVPNSVLVVGDETLERQLAYSLMFHGFEPKNTALIQGTKINDYDADFLRRFDFIFLVKGSVDEKSIDKLKYYKSQGGKIIPDVLNGQNSVSNNDLNSIFNATKGNLTEIKIKDYSSNKITVELNGEKGWLVASERFAYFPGWAARINGKEAEIQKADNVISAVYLDGEKGSLVFEYSPSSYKNGKIISGISLIIIIIYMAYFIYSRKFGKGGKNQA